MRAHGPRYGPYNLKNGVFHKPWCYNQRPLSEVGVKGWPCSSGGSVAHSSTMEGAPELQCVVFYSPMTSQFAWVRARGTNLAAFKSAEQYCRAEIIRPDAQSDMTALAKCIYDHYPYLHLTSGGVTKFQGVAVFPGSNAAHEAGPHAFALYAPLGFIIDETLSFFPLALLLPPKMLPDLNHKPPYLYVIAAMGQ